MRKRQRGGYYILPNVMYVLKVVENINRFFSSDILSSSKVEPSVVETKAQSHVIPSPPLTQYLAST